MLDSSRSSARPSRFEDLLYQRRDCLYHDRQIKPDRHITGIKYVHGDHFVERGFVLPVDLPIASETGWRIDSLLLPRFITLKLMRKAWARTNQAHFSPKNVKNLR